MSEYYNIPAKKGSKIAELLDHVIRADNAGTLVGICVTAQARNGKHSTFGANHDGPFNLQALLNHMNVVSKGKPELPTFHKPPTEIKA